MTISSSKARRDVIANAVLATITKRAAIGVVAGFGAAAVAPAAFASEPTPFGAQSIVDARDSETLAGAMKFDEIEASNVEQREAINSLRAELEPELALDLDLDLDLDLEFDLDAETEETVLSTPRGADETAWIADGTAEGRALHAEMTPPTLAPAGRIDIETATIDVETARETKLGGDAKRDGGEAIETATVDPRRGGESLAETTAELDGETALDADARVKNAAIEGFDAAREAALDEDRLFAPSAEVDAPAFAAEHDVFAAVDAAGAPIDLEDATLDPIIGANGSWSETEIDAAAAPFDREAAELDAVIGETSAAIAEFDQTTAFDRDATGERAPL